MSKKYDEVDEIILNDLDNLVIFESFYSEDGMFMEDIYKKFQKDKKILDDINDKYSKKHGPTSLIMKDNRMLNLKEIITKLNWAEKFEKLISDNCPNLDEYRELKSEYIKLEKKHSKNKKGNNNNNINNNAKEKKEKASTKKKAVKENFNNQVNNNIDEELKAPEDFKKEEDSVNSQFFKNEFHLLNTFIYQSEEWRNSFKNKLDILTGKIQEFEMQERNVANNIVSTATEGIIVSSQASEITILQENNDQAKVSNNSTVKNSKKKGCKKKQKIKEELIEENQNQAKEMDIIPIEAEIPLEAFAEKFTEEEFTQMLDSFEKLQIKSNEDLEFLEKHKKEYVDWEKRFKKIKNMDFITAQMLLLKAKKLILFTSDMKSLLFIFNSCLKWRNDANSIVENYKNILDEFYFDTDESKVKITDGGKLISHFNNNKSLNPDNHDAQDKNELIQNKEKTNLTFNSTTELINHINVLKEEYKTNSLIKDSSLNIFNTLASLEDKLKSTLFITNKVLCDENDLDFLKYFLFQLCKFPLIFSDAIEKITKKIEFIENFNSLINGEQALNSIQSLNNLEAKLTENHINSDKIKIQINEKKNILLEAQNNLDNIKKSFLDKGKMPNRKYLLEMQNNIRLNKLFLETKYSLLINSWNIYYDWYENIIKLLIMLNNQNKKNKNKVCFISEKNIS